MNRYAIMARGTLMVLMIVVVASISIAGDDSTLTDEQFEQRLQQDPAATFSSDPIRAWETIEMNPNLMTDPQILDTAFENDVYAAGRVLNQNPYLLSDANIAARFEEAAQYPAVHSVDIHGHPSNEFLNSNPDATRIWLEQKYQLRMANGASFLEYDGVSLTTRGESGTTFNINDFPSATINRDGSLTYQHTTFKGATALAVNQANGQVQMIGGEARGTRETSITLEATDGTVYTGERGSVTSYRGSFILVQENGVTQASSREGQPGFIYNNNLRVTGIIIRRPRATGLDMRPNDFIVEGNAVLNKVVPSEVRGELVFNNNLDSLRIQSSAQVYYSRDRERGSAVSCPGGMTCIVDSSTDFNVEQRTRFAVLGMTNNDEITFTTPAYYDHVEVINAQSGHVTIQSVSPTNYPLGSIRVGARDDIMAQGTALEHMNFGRVDVVYPENPSCTGEPCQQILHHWSSPEFPGETAYFQAAHNTYVGRQQGTQNALLRCTLGVDCEERVARNFGKAIGVPTGGTARTTIIVAGDNADTARSLEQWCGGNGGCYIFNSRDVPSITNSQNLVITGHHYQDENNVWRDAETNQFAPEGSHTAIDRMYFDPVEHGSPFDHLPTGNNIEVITFSACNTVVSTSTDETNEGFRGLREVYPGLRRVQGWSGTAPRQEELRQPFSISEGPYTNVYPGQTEPHGRRAWFIRDTQNRDRWFWTNDGNTCIPVTGGGGQQECPVEAAIAQR